MDDSAEKFFKCEKCGAPILSGFCILCNQSYILEDCKIDNQGINEDDIPNYELGDSVIIINSEHPWFNDIALVADLKHKFVRIEIHGKKVWLSEEWVKKYED